MSCERGDAKHEPTAAVREYRLEPLATCVMRYLRHTLLANVETVNDVEVTLWIDPFEVIQQPSPTTDQHQQAPPAGEIPLVTLQVPGQPVDPRRQNGNLDLRGASIVGTPLILPDQTRFPLSSNSHLLPRLLHLGLAQNAPTGSEFLPPCLLQLCLQCVTN